MSTPAPAEASEPATLSTVPWYGPKSQFWPHLIIWAIIRAFFISLVETFVRLWRFINHPVKSMRGLWYCVAHPCFTLAGYRDRMMASLKHHGMFFTGTCLVFSLVLLPGAGLFGEVAEWAEYSEAGREAERLFGAKLLPDGTSASDKPAREDEPAQGHVSETAEARA